MILKESHSAIFVLTFEASVEIRLRERTSTSTDSRLCFVAVFQLITITMIAWSSDDSVDTASREDEQYERLGEYFRSLLLNTTTNIFF